ncbi:hypothetical protein Efla_000911 [Eimeria flavescens]
MAAQTPVWRATCASGLSSFEAFSRQHRLNHIHLGPPSPGRAAPGMGASSREAFHRGGPWGPPPPRSSNTDPQLHADGRVWEAGNDGFARRMQAQPGIGSGSGASGSPLAAAAAAAATAAAAAAAVRQAFAATPLWTFGIKMQIAAKCAFYALTRPTEDLHIATLSEVFADSQLERMRQLMMADEEGRRVLQQRPLFDDRFVDYEGLRRLPKDTLGYALAHFLDSNLLHAGHRQPVRLVEDEELAYVLTRYRQLHDVMHAAFKLGISVEAEVALKLIEFHQTGLPMTLLAAAFGPLAAPLLRVHLPAAAADAAHAGPSPAAVAGAAHDLTGAPNSWMQLLLPPPSPAAASSAAAAASKPETAAAAAAASEPAAAAAAAAGEEEPVVLYPRYALLNELLPWVRKGPQIRVYMQLCSTSICCFECLSAASNPAAAAAAAGRCCREGDAASGVLCFCGRMARQAPRGLQTALRHQPPTRGLAPLLPLETAGGPLPPTRRGPFIGGAPAREAPTQRTSLIRVAG